MTELKPTSATGNPQSLQHVLALLKAGVDVRNAKIRRLKAALRTSRYENDLKLSIAADRLLRDL